MNCNRNWNICLKGNVLQSGFGLLLEGLFHTDSVDHQLKLLQDLRLVPLDITVDRFVEQQLGWVVKSPGENQCWAASTANSS